MTHDLLIKNARVVDGTGEPSFQADVAVTQGPVEIVTRSAQPRRNCCSSASVSFGALSCKE